MGEERDREYAMKVLGSIIEISKSDPAMATKILVEESKRNPHLAPLNRFRFVAKTSRDNWATVEAGDGHAFMVHLPSLARISEGPLDRGREFYSGAIRLVGRPCPGEVQQ